MAEWQGETSAGSTEADRFIRNYVMRLITDGDCKPDVAHTVVHDLLTDLGERLNQLAAQAQQG